MLADIPGIEFIIFDKSRGRRAYGDLRWVMRGRRFDAALCMHASLRANLICRLINTNYRLGFDRTRAKDYQWLFTNQSIDAVPRQHVLDGLFEFAEHIGVPRPANLRWDIPLADADIDAAALKIDVDKPIVAISPCSSQRSRNFRNWSAARYAAIANYASSAHDCQIVLTGGPTGLERDYGAAISQLCVTPPSNRIGQTSLKQLLAVIGQARVLVCPDSGPAHMATTVNTPVIGLYATSNPERTGPFLSLQHVVDAYPEAVRRYLGKAADEVPWGARVRNADAMDLIQTEQVIAKLDALLR